MKIEAKNIKCKINIEDLINEAMNFINLDFNLCIPRESISLKKYGDCNFVLRLLKSKIKLNKSNKYKIENIFKEYDNSELDFQRYIIKKLFNFDLSWGEDYGYIKFHSNWDTKEEYYYIEIPFEKYKLLPMK